MYTQTNVLQFNFSLLSMLHNMPPSAWSSPGGGAGLGWTRGGAPRQVAQGLRFSALGAHLFENLLRPGGSCS